MAITRRKDGRAMQTIVIDGKRKTFYSAEKTDKKAQKDIQQQMINYKHELHQQRHNFLKLAEQMLDEHEGTISYSTHQGYVHALKHLKPFYNKDIEDISASAVQNLIDNMVQQQYSYSAIQKTKTTFGMVLSYAIRHDIELTDFRRSLKIPRTVKHKKVTSPDDIIIKTVAQSATTVEWGMWAMCLLCTGYRRGELNAIQKKSIDFDTNTIYFMNTTEFVHNQPRLKNTAKSTSGERDMPILAILKPLLYDMIKDMNPDDFIFGGASPLSETQLNKRWKKYCKNIGHTFTMHQLRHAYAKLLYKAGVDVKTAQRLLGHADISTTMNIYTDFSDEVTQASVEKINNYMNEYIDTF